MEIYKTPVLGFAAHSGTGKTTLLTQIIPILRTNNLKIGIIKHSHHSFDIDHPGKDSYRLRSAGASSILIASSQRTAVITEIFPPQEPNFSAQVDTLTSQALDLILVEGFKSAPFPKIELHRPILKKTLLFPKDNHIIAVASDHPIDLPSHLKALDLNKPNEIAQFILTEFLPNYYD